MHFCAINNAECEGRVQWHHVWIYAGTQIDEEWAIVGACEHHHEMVNGNKIVREAFQRESLRLATGNDLAKYPRKDWGFIREKLGI